MSGTPDGPGSGAPSGLQVPVAGRLAITKQRLRDGARAVFEPLAALLARLGVRPDHLTVAGLALSALSGLLFLLASWRLGGLVLALAGLCDILDGQLARRSGGETRFGAFLDSTIDRLSEALVILGITGFFVRFAENQPLDVSPTIWTLVVTFLGMLALVGSFLVSYTRARAEGLGIDCKVGWFERPERIALLVIAGLLGNLGVMFWALALLGLLSFWTAFQRVRHVWRQTRGAELDPPEGMRS